MGVAPSADAPIKPLLKPSKAGESFVGGRWPPDARSFVVEQSAIRLPSHVELGSIEGGEPTVLVEDAVTPIFAAGHLLYVRDGRLFAHPFDLAARKLLGTPLVLADQMDSAPNQGAAYSASDRVVVYSGDGTAGRSRLTWLDRTGRVLANVSDGKRFIVNARIASRLPPSLNLIVNWTELVRRNQLP